MAKKLANDYRLWIESVTPGTYNSTYNMVKGQQDLSVSRSGGTIDTSTKDDFPYGTSGPGLRSVTIPYSLIPDLPDANGYTRLETLTNAAVATPFNIQIRKGGSAGNSTTDVVFAGSVYNTDFTTGLGQNDAVKASGTLVSAAAPTTDVLA
jgi:hypothetical protein